MRFVCTTSNYRSFRGYVFAYGKPTTVRDRATLEAIRKDPSFSEVKEEHINPDECPKCGKFIRRGRVMHVRFCKGR